MRLIDADELIKKSLTKFDWSDVVDVDDINNAPTIDPEGLRPHGKWLTRVYEYGGSDFEVKPAKQGDTAYCSECNNYALLNGGEEYCLSNYCPHCGAIMNLQEQKGVDLT
ncbi:MAG: hypothetical protein K2H01_11050 [Ruminococcus sp.]|nr:hypothetical protein [Ruminococcus sp.]